ncbi:MAG TPA: thioredoxin domain-containing protein [Blastocatellia bacterium]|nr:thioredoxin domain-containing protein [Blastocatellia bacterium]
MISRSQIVKLTTLALLVVGLGGGIFCETVSAQIAGKPAAKSPTESATKSPAKYMESGASASAVAAVVDGKAISAADLEAMAHNQLIALETSEYELKRRMLGDAIDKLLFEQEAAHRGLTVEQLTAEEIDGKVSAPSEDQLRVVYESTSNQYGDTPEAIVLKQIDSNLRRGRIALRREEFLKELRRKARIQINLDPPRMRVDAADDRVVGPKTAPVTIVEFSDFQCPYCARSVATIKRIEAEYGNKIRVVFQDFPLPMHRDAPKASEAALCANEQGKFWEMHDTLFQNQANLGVPALEGYAVAIGLNPAQFHQCLDSGKYARKWEDEKLKGAGYGITGTPTFFVNGRMLVGAKTFDEFSQVIQEELERSDMSKGAAPTAASSGGLAPPARVISGQTMPPQQ